MEKLNTQARVSEIGDLAIRWIELFRKTEAVKEDKYLKTFFAELEKLLEQITEAVKREGVASKLDDADIARDKAVRALGKIFSGYKNISLPAIQPHGEKLSEVFKKYGTSIAKKSYSEETHLIESLLKDLQNPNLSESITALTGVSEAIADLKINKMPLPKFVQNMMILWHSTKPYRVPHLSKSLYMNSLTIILSSILMRWK